MENSKNKIGGLIIQENATSLVIQIKWPIFGAVLMFGFIVFLAVVSVKGEYYKELNIFSVFMAIFTAYVLYMAVMQLANTTTVVLDKSRLAVTHEPITFLGHGNIDISTSEIQQIYCKKRRGKKSGWGYMLCLKTKNRGHIEILNRLIDEEEALLLEKKFEDFLGIKDEAVNVKLGVREKIVSSKERAYLDTHVKERDQE